MDERIYRTINTLKLRGYSKRTVESYRSNLEKFFNNQPINPTLETINKYIVELIDEGKLSESSINQLINSINFYLRWVDKSEYRIKIKHLRKAKKLPQVLSKEEVDKLLKYLKNKKHKTLFSLIYSSGLRVGEVVKLKIEDLDFDRMLIHIRCGKGKKDRFTLLSKYSEKLLSKYIPTIQYNSYLFPGQKINSHLSVRSVQAIMQRALEKLGIKKGVTVHSLRHSFATHLLEQGVDIRVIQEILGHKNIKTTEIYTHVALPNIRNIKNPLDNM